MNHFASPRSTASARTCLLGTLATGILLVAGCDSDGVLPESTAQTHPAAAPTTPAQSSAEPTTLGVSNTAATAAGEATTVAPAATDTAATTPAATVAAGPVRTRDITFDTVKFPIEKDAPYDPKLLTEEVRNLVGKPIRVRGYMHPNVFQQTGIKQFILVRDNMECCFGPGAALYDCMAVQMAEGADANFQVRPFAVEGTFDVEPIDDDGQVFILFHLRNAVVR